MVFGQDMTTSWSVVLLLVDSDDEFVAALVDSHGGFVLRLPGALGERWRRNGGAEQERQRQCETKTDLMHSSKPPLCWHRIDRWPNMPPGSRAEFGY